MLSFLYRLRGDPGETVTISSQVDALRISEMEDAQGDVESGKQTQAKHGEEEP